MNFSLVSCANNELTLATLYYEKQNKGLGREFLDEVESTIN